MNGLKSGTFKEQARGGGVWTALGEAHSEQGTAQIPLQVVLSHLFLPRGIFTGLLCHSRSLFLSRASL